jgi:hypothetical protein
MGVGVAAVQIESAARPEEILQECQWVAQYAGERRRDREGLLLCRDIGHGGYPSEDFAGMAGL